MVLGVAGDGEEVLEADEGGLVLVEDGEGLPVVEADDVPVGAAEGGRVRVQVEGHAVDAGRVGGVVERRAAVRHPAALDVRQAHRLAHGTHVVRRVVAGRAEDGGQAVAHQLADLLRRRERVGRRQPVAAGQQFGPRQHVPVAVDALHAVPEGHLVVRVGAVEETRCRFPFVCSFFNQSTSINQRVALELVFHPIFGQHTIKSIKAASMAEQCQQKLSLCAQGLR